MAKKSVETKADKSKDELKGKSKGISIAKYLQLHGSDIHKYTRAYIEVQFCDIIKATEAWKEEINKIMEGNK